MAAENGWQGFVVSAMIGGAPLLASFLLTPSPWNKSVPMNNGWAAAYSRDIDSESSKRKYFRLPLWALALCYVIATAGLAIGTYVLIHNGGLNNGMDVFTFPLLMAFSSVFFANVWVPQYLTKSVMCYNYGWLQVLAIITAVVTLVLYLENMDTIYAIWSALWLIWTVVAFGKTYVEDHYGGCSGSDAAAGCAFPGAINF